MKSFAIIAFSTAATLVVDAQRLASCNGFEVHASLEGSDRTDIEVPTTELEQFAEYDIYVQDQLETDPCTYDDSKWGVLAAAFTYYGGVNHRSYETDL